MKSEERPRPDVVWTGHIKSGVAKYKTDVLQWHGSSDPGTFRRCLATLGGHGAIERLLIDETETEFQISSGKSIDTA